MTYHLLAQSPGSPQEVRITVEYYAIINSLEEFLMAWENALCIKFNKKKIKIIWIYTMIQICLDIHTFINTYIQK